VFTRFLFIASSNKEVVVRDYISYAKDTPIRACHSGSSMETKLKKTTGELRTNNVANDHARKIQKLKKTRTASENVERVLQFDTECEQNGHKLASRYSALITLHYLCRFAGKKPFMRLTKADLMNFLAAVKIGGLRAPGYRAGTRDVENNSPNPR